MDEGTSGKHAHVSSYRAGGATRVVKAKLQCCRIARETLENTLRLRAYTETYFEFC